MLTTFNEVDMSNLMAMRNEFKVRPRVWGGGLAGHGFLAGVFPRGWWVGPCCALLLPSSLCPKPAPPPTPATPPRALLPWQDAFLDKHGVKLGFMSAFVKGAASALQEVPAVNGVIEGDEIVYR
jgi:hypothetical protein